MCNRKVGFHEFMPAASCYIQEQNMCNLRPKIQK